MTDAERALELLRRIVNTDEYARWGRDAVNERVRDEYPDGFRRYLTIDLTMGVDDGDLALLNRLMGSTPIRHVPDGFWRRVPCGHPSEPEAWANARGVLFCHCGAILFADQAYEMEDVGKLVSCMSCGCHVRIEAA